MSGDQPNISIGSVTGGQNNIGKTEIAGDQNQTNYHGDAQLTPEKVVDKVADALPEPLRQSIIPQMQSLLSTKPDEVTPETETKIQALCDQIKPHAGTIWKNLALFGEGALESLAKMNPIVNGIWKVCSANKLQPDSAPAYSPPRPYQPPRPYKPPSG